MAGKPTYEELERKIKELEEEAANRERVDEMLREAQTMAQLIDLAPFGVFLIDLRGKIVTCNRRGAERLGKTVETSIGTALTEYFPAEVSENRMLKGMEAIASGQTVSFEDRLGERWYRNSISPILDEDGRPLRLAIYGLDITEYKNALEALGESEEKYRELVENLNDVIFSVNAAGTITYVSPPVESILGYTPVELIGKHFSYLIHPEDMERIHRTFSDTLQGRLYPTEYRVRTKNGEYLWVSASSLPVHVDGQISGLQGVITDITEHKRAEEERVKLEKQLHRAQKMAALGTLVAGVAHEINNPNNFITINAPMLNKVWLGIKPILEEYYNHNGDFSVVGLPYTIMRERVPQLLAGISDGAGRIKKIVSDLKRFAHPDPSASFEPVDINATVKSSLTLVSNLLKNSTNNFKVEYGHNIPKVNGNHQHLEQVVINLLQNACQALPDKNKGIRISTTYQEKEETILIQVMDQGVGIPSESLPSIMDPFFTTRRSSGGTGLGLSVSFSIIEKHQGKLTVVSENSKGTTFTIALPAKGKKNRVKVLVVDDNDLLRETIVEAIQKDTAFSVEEAPNGTDACIKLGAFRPDLLILDIRMPDMSGVEVCRRIKADPAFSNMKVIIITGFPGGDDAGKIAEMGFGNFCAKPIKMKNFEAMVQGVLNRY